MMKKLSRKELKKLNAEKIKKYEETEIYVFENLGSQFHDSSFVDIIGILAERVSKLEEDKKKCEAEKLALAEKARKLEAEVKKLKTAK